MAKRVGVFSGTFDPVHRGHIEACVVAFGVLELDTVLLFLEKEPRRKQEVADFRDRANMLELATLDYPSLRIVDLGTKNIITSDSLKFLETQFKDAEYWYIVGSDMLAHMEDWPEAEKLFMHFNLCIVLRDNNHQTEAEKQVKQLHKLHPNTRFEILPSVWSPVSSSMVKQAVKDQRIIPGLDPAVHEYIRRHRLYQ